MSIKSLIKKVLSNDIARRSFVKNGFDGVLTVIGVLVALFLSRVTDPRIAILSCIGSGIAMCVSGLWGAYVTESAERKVRVMKIEKHLLKKLKGTKITDQSREASIVVALVDGLTPMMVTLLLVIPFLLTSVIGINWAYYSTFILSGIIITFLGVFIGKLSKDNILVNVLKMLSAAGAVLLIMYLIELFKVV
jgi:predicted membrane protein (TIGR00267 family)